jgi:hypothetical protein
MLYSSTSFPLFKVNQAACHGFEKISGDFKTNSIKIDELKKTPLTY